MAVVLHLNTTAIETDLKENTASGTHNLKYQPSVKANELHMPPLHIKLGLVERCVKELIIKATLSYTFRTCFHICQKLESMVVFSRDQMFIRYYSHKIVKK